MTDTLPRLLVPGKDSKPCDERLKQGLQFRRSQFRTGSLALSLTCEHVPERRFVDLMDLKDLKVPDPDSQRHMSQIKLQMAVQGGS